MKKSAFNSNSKSAENRLRTKNEKYGYAFWVGVWVPLVIFWTIVEGDILASGLIFAIVVIGATLTFAHKTVNGMVFSVLLVAIPASIVVWGLISFVLYPNSSIFTLTSYKTAIITFFAYCGGCLAGEGITDFRKRIKGK